MKYAVINKDMLENEFTIGAEFYHPDYIEKVEAVQNKSNVYLLQDLCKLITDGDHSKTQYVIKGGILYLLSESIKEGYIDTRYTKYISNDLHNSLKRSQLKPRDIVLTKTGVYFGKSAVIPDNFHAANTSAHVARLVVNENSIGINPYYLSTFLNCGYGYAQLRRRGIKASRPEVKLVELSDIKVFVPCLCFQNEIEKCIKNAVKLLNRSEDVLYEGQELLLSQLKLKNWQPKHTLAYIKEYSDVIKNNRIDAEYYQPKYELIENTIKNYKRGYSFIGDEFKQNRSVCTTESNKHYKYVEIGSINVTNGEITPTLIKGSELPANAKRSLKIGDIIVSKVRPYRGAIALVDSNDYIGSSAFTTLRESGCVKKEVLLAYLRLKPLLQLMFKPATGISYPVIVDSDILKLPVPLFAEETQNQIKDVITLSNGLRLQAKQMLESAKRAVETAIEQNEQDALYWLNSQIGDLDAPGL